jgi:anti-sigma regulatory factor (Ser/Thr protein kinase)
MEATTSMQGRLRLEAEPASPRAARRFVERILRLSGHPVRQEILLLVSELVTNAVEHVGHRLELVVAVDRDRIRVEVLDPGVDGPLLRQPSPTDPRGRGLLLVDRIARAWGSERIPRDGKRVWFEVAA